MLAKLFKVCLWIVLLGALSTLNAQNNKHSGIKVHASPNDYPRLASLGLLPDHFHPSSHSFFVAEYSEWEQTILKSSGLAYEVLWDDASARYVAQNNAAVNAVGSKITTAIQPVGFNLGSMGGYLTYDELVRELDSMRFNFPNLISQKFGIGTSVEGRTIWAIRISDNPNVDESEPEVLYDALHHAREPISLMALTYYMHYLLENYNLDSTVHYLIDHREMYFVPIVNPDGYVYNQMTNPQGGGLWRKNRRFNGNGSFGVDLNRNYGYEWGFDTLGSSNHPSSNTFRGNWAFSEPETRAMRDFCDVRQFRIAQSEHSFGEYMIHPWGHQPQAPPLDAERFHDFGALLTRQNGYTVGTNAETVGYLANGTSDDWMYGDVSLKDKIYAFSPELGSSADGFWPPSPTIAGMCADLVDQNLVAAWLAGDCVTPQPQTGREFDGPVAHLKVDFRNFGLLPSLPFFAEYVSTDPYIQQVLIPGMNLPFISVNAKRTDSFAVEMSNLTPRGHHVRGLVRTHLQGGIVLEDSLNFIYGLPTTLFEDDGEGPTSNAWTGGWALTAEKAFTGLQSYTDSPWNNYLPSTISAITTAQAINLTNYSYPLLRFAASWNLERGYDYVQVSASTDGVNFTPLQSEHSRLGAGTMQPPGSPLYDGLAHQWLQETVDLSAYSGQQVYLRFELQSDAWGFRDGFYFDDVLVTGYLVPTAIDDPLHANGLLTPNPAQGCVKVSLPEDFDQSHLRLTNLIGQVLLDLPVTDGAAIDLSQLSSGVYLYQFTREGQTSPPQKLVIR